MTDLTGNSPTSGEMIAADAAKALGFQLTANGLANVGAQIDVLGKIEAGSPVTVGDVPVADWLAAQIAASPSWKVTEAPKTTAPTGNRTERAIGTNAAARVDRTGKARDAYEAHGNPWLSSKINRSVQGIISNSDPALADRLRQEASL